MKPKSPFKIILTLKESTVLSAWNRIYIVRTVPFRHILTQV